MTPIQEQSLPLILEGKDLVAQAQTGSGKTAAFGLGVLHHLQVKQFRVQALILCPTRELADQVAQELRRLARAIHNIKILLLSGGMPFGPQVGSLEHGAHIIVGTPGRVEEHLRKEHLNLDHLKLLVMDEADRMLDMGFQESVDNIMSYAPSARQNLLFSATYPDNIQAMAKRVMHQPTVIKVATVKTEENHIEQAFCNIDELPVEKSEQRGLAVQLLLKEHKPSSVVVFCNTKRETQQLADDLLDEGFSVIALHGDLEQRDRDRGLVQFANKSATILVATDVAARGLDIEAVDMVINYQISRELDVHTHRIGRTGRAGLTGLAFTLFTQKEQFKLDALAEKSNQPCELQALPSVDVAHRAAYQADMVTLHIQGGKKDKVRPGDIVGAITSTKRLSGNDIGKIAVLPHAAYVAVKRDCSREALAILNKDGIKKRKFKVRRL